MAEVSPGGRKDAYAGTRGGCAEEALWKLKLALYSTRASPRLVQLLITLLSRSLNRLWE